MRRILLFFALIIILFSSFTLRAQSSIVLNVFPGLNSIDFAAFTFTNNLNGAPRIFQVDIHTSPAGKRVVISGKIDWKQDDNSGFIQLVNFTTLPFTARSFYNDEIGNSDIKIDKVDGNKDLAKQNVEKGKPTGIYSISLNLLDDKGNYLSSTSQQISFLNPAPTLTILSPQENSSFDVGYVQAQWTPVQGAAYYIVRANIIPPGSTNVEDALNSSNPVINDKNVGNVAVVNLSTILDRQWVDGQRIVLAVTAYVAGPGGGTSLKSLPVTFLLNKSGSNSTSPANPNLVRLGNLLTGRTNQEFVTKLMTGQITIDEIKISDENGNSIAFPDFLNIISFLEVHPESIISVNYNANK